MTTPNIDLGALPTTKTYASATTGGNVNLTGRGSFYQRLPEGVSTISVSGHGPSLTVHLTTGTSASTRYHSETAAEGRSLVLSNVAVPSGELRYLHISADGPGDVGVTIITWPLA